MSMLKAVNKLRKLTGQKPFSFKCYVPGCDQRAEFDLPNGTPVCSDHFVSFVDFVETKN
jgi:glucuronate isomerase